MPQTIFIGLRDTGPDAALVVYSRKAPACFTWNHDPVALRQHLGCRFDEAAPIDWRLDLVRHSPVGLDCGYLGSGPAQLALAMLAAVTDDEEALRSHQVLKERLVAGLPRHTPWLTTERQIRATLHDLLPPPPPELAELVERDVAGARRSLAHSGPAAIN